jgi:hypothetical protein
MSEVPACFTHLLAAWNEYDPIRLREQVEKSVTPDVVFTDPHYAINGREAFIEMIQAFQARVGKVQLVRTSVIDIHHDRARYAWEVVWPNGNRFEGFDAVALDPTLEKVCRIDGFFGPLKAAVEGIPK